MSGLVCAMVVLLVYSMYIDARNLKIAESQSRAYKEIAFDLGDEVRHQQRIIDKYNTMESVRVCKITFYCDCIDCCGKTNGITATGTKATEGRTVGADPSVYPYGTKLFIEGLGYRTVEDTGGAIEPNQIDVFMDNHDDALTMGVRHAFVIQVKEDK